MVNTETAGQADWTQVFGKGGADITAGSKYQNCWACLMGPRFLVSVLPL